MGDFVDAMPDDPNDPDIDAGTLYQDHIWAKNRYVRRAWRPLWRIVSKDYRQYEFLRLPKEVRIRAIRERAKGIMNGHYFKSLPLLDDLVGRQDEVNVFLASIYRHILRNKDAMEMTQPPPKVFIVKGEPGSGKSFLVKAAAREAFLRSVEEGFILDLKTLEGAAVNSPFMGMYSGAISGAFQDAQKKPTFLWIDEAQQLVQKGSNLQGDSASKEYQQAESAILTALDNIMSSPVRTVVVMGSNTVESIREDVRRRAFLIDLDSPGLNHDAMIEIVRRKLKNLRLDLDAEKVLYALEQELRNLGEARIVPHDITRAFDAVISHSERPIREKFLNRLRGEKVDRIPITIDSFKAVARDVRSYKEQAATQAVQDAEQTVPPPDRYSDVGGLKGIKDEVIKEVTLSLNPGLAGDRWQQPRGYLFYGPGGTGKTLLAKAIAGENKVPIFVVNAASLMMPIVGESEKSMRQLFSRARNKSPSIIFVDEIDTIGRARGTSIGGSSHVTESMLTTLLTCLDGFAPKGRMVFIGATNRKDILDPALLQRLDKQFEFTFPKTTAEKLDVIRAQLAPFAQDTSITPEEVLRLFLARTFSPRESADCIKEAARMSQMEQIACRLYLQAEQDIDGPMQKMLKKNYSDEFERILRRSEVPENSVCDGATAVCDCGISKGDCRCGDCGQCGAIPGMGETHIVQVYRRVAERNPFTMEHMALAFDRKVITDADRERMKYSQMHRSAGSEVGKGYGLATDSTGTKGIFLTIECAMYPAQKPGRGEVNALGNLGVGAKESAWIGRDFIRRFSPDIMNYDFTIHVVSLGEGGETPAVSGPSAGMAMMFTLMSTYMGWPFSKDVCMTGKVDLNGIVGIVGGIQPKTGAGKLDAARENNFKYVLIPKVAYDELAKDWSDYLQASKESGTEIVGGATWLDYAGYVFGDKGDFEKLLTERKA